jgi:hypothetical protein
VAVLEKRKEEDIGMKIDSIFEINRTYGGQ